MWDSQGGKNEQKDKHVINAKRLFKSITCNVFKHLSIAHTEIDYTSKYQAKRNPDDGPS